MVHVDDGDEHLIFLVVVGIQLVALGQFLFIIIRIAVLENL